MEASIRRVLLALSSHSELGDTEQPTGYYVPEAAHPWKVFSDAGLAVDFVSVAGGAAPPAGYDARDEVQREFMTDPAIASRLANTPRGSQVSPSDYSAVLFVGGH